MVFDFYEVCGVIVEYVGDDNGCEGLDVEIGGEVVEGLEGWREEARRLILRCNIAGKW